MRYTALLLLLLAPGLWGQETLRIAVAANFKPALEHINTEFSAATGITLRLSSASTGVLASQLRHGAPFDLFFAADAARPRQLADLAAPGAGPPACYARGRLVLAGGDLPDLALPQRSLAIANPLVAPYGRAALQVLERKAFSAGAGRKLVRGQNVAQAFQYWHSGAVDLALLPAAMAPAGAVPVPASWHEPIEQHLLVLGQGPTVDRYLKWFRSDRVRSLILDAGYEPCP